MHAESLTSWRQLPTESRRRISLVTLAGALGHAAHRRVMANYLDDRHLIRTAELLEGMLQNGRVGIGASIMDQGGNRRD